MNAKELTHAWDERYSQQGLAFGDQPNDFLRSQEQRILAGGKRALCLAEGEGRNAVWLAQLGLEVTAIDLSAVGLRKAAERAAAHGLTITTEQADLSTWRFEPGAWDLIVWVFCHLPPQIRAHVQRGVVRGLAPNGLLVQETYAPTQISRGTGGPSDARLLATAQEVQAGLQGLEFLEVREISRDVSEGRLHTGMADVVQIVAIKR